MANETDSDTDTDTDADADADTDPAATHPLAHERGDEARLTGEAASVDDRIKTAGIKTTLPMGSIPIIAAPGFDPESSTAKRMKSATFPPERWGKERDLISSASAPTSQRTDATAGIVTLNSERMPEELAREVIGRRFAQYDYVLKEDFPFAYKDTVVMLDGFDPNRRVGFQYLSHADQDVVTDHDVATSETLKLLEQEGLARVLVVHDGEVITSDALIAIVDKFLAVPSPK